MHCQAVYYNEKLGNSLTRQTYQWPYIKRTLSIDEEGLK
jgi:hypothetical protein